MDKHSQLHKFVHDFHLADSRAQQEIEYLIRLVMFTFDELDYQFGDGPYVHPDSFQY
jgi:hypothetical protein